MEKIKSLFAQQDMTIGKPSSCLLKFIIPMLIGNIAQLLLTTFDSAIVGSIMGDAALGAVGASMPILNIFMVFFMAVGSGVTVMVSQFFGARDKENLSKTVGNTVTLMIIISIVVTSVAVPLTGSILKLLDTAPELYDLAYDYVIILFCGCATIGFYNIFTGILRGIGVSIFPLIVLLGSVVLNGFLDVWFVLPKESGGLGLGIAGAAYATVIAQLGAAVACMIKAMRYKETFVINKESMKLSKAIVKQIARLGLPSGVQMAIMSLSNMFIQPYIMRMGYQVMAAMTATMRVDGFALLPSQAFSMGVSTYTGQNIGAGKEERLKPGMWATLRTSLIVSAIMIAAMLLFGRNVLGLFTKTDEIIDMSMSFIYTMLPVYFLAAINMTLMGVMRGAGDSIGTMWISVLMNVIIKLPATILIIHLTMNEIFPNGNPKSTFYGMLVSMAFGFTITIIYYRLGKWKNKSVVKPKLDLSAVEL